jgi:hypothetical protein
LSGISAAQNYGKPIVANVAAKYQLWTYMWPEFELNVT